MLALEWYNRDRCKPFSPDSINPFIAKEMDLTQYAMNKYIVFNV